MKSNERTNIRIQLTTALLLTLITLFALPAPAAALSCLNPAEMIERYAAEETYTVALIEAGVIETKGEEHNQTITTKTLYKGALNTTDTVTFTFDETWDYLCTGGPATEGAEALYVLNEKQVVQVFASDSEFAESLTATIGTPEVQPTAVTVKETAKKSLREQIVGLLKQLISLLSQTNDVVVPTPIETIESPDYIGMSSIEAAAAAEANDVLFRVVEINGVPQAVTEDFKEGRINASLENDVITEYSVETMNPVVKKTPLTEPGNHETIIGLTTDEAKTYAGIKGVDFRVGMIDGEPLPLDMDYRIGRITAEVRDGVVTGYSVE